jgi:hypothetical protein
MVESSILVEATWSARSSAICRIVLVTACRRGCLVDCRVSCSMNADKVFPPSVNGAGICPAIGSYNQHISNTLRKGSTLTSPFSVCAVIAASTVLFMASHAHLSRRRVHGSGSSFRRGVYKVGHSADFRFREGNVNADDVGTGSRYGVGRLRSTGNFGGSKEMPKRREVISSRFRMRFK